MSLLRYSIVFRGNVQGVGFRATARIVAAGMAIGGWVRNEPDGTVRCVAEGTEEDLRQFVASVEQAMRGRVQQTEIMRDNATGEFIGFEIRR